MTLAVSKNLVFAPPNGGMNAQGFSFPGFSKTQHYTVGSGEALWLTLQANDLVSLLPRNTFRIASIDLTTGNDAIQSIISEPLRPIATKATNFDSRVIATRLNGLGLNFDSLQIYEFNLIDNKDEPIVWKPKKDIILLFIQPETPINLVNGSSKIGNISVEVQKVNTQALRLPTPLGHVVDEFTIERGTARSYALKEGQFVQIIDVEGRQCSDFMAFNTRALEKGLEKHIDSTVSRTFTRAAYPRPGLLDKFFDADITPLLSVVQDTVGRHDTFALACTARGYEERGFPGHVNCSDNISNAVSSYGIKSRAAWPAINFFFNSWILPNDNLMNSDEAWSRPEDYVLMKALTDLVCVSTACPDDIDPINGWNPTDIHIRIYDKKAQINQAISYRLNPNDPAAMTQPSPLHAKTSKLTKQYSPNMEYWTPDFYEATGAIEEYWACREKAVIQDMSNLRIFDIYGIDAQRLLQDIFSRDVSRLSLNKGMYGLLCDKSGSVLDDGTLFHIGPSLFRWICSSNESLKHIEKIAQQRNYHAWVRNMTKNLCTISVQGRESQQILNDLLFLQPTQTSFMDLPWFGSCIARLHHRTGIPMMVSRTGYTGELGYELFCDQRSAESVWDAVCLAGGENITPMGNTALDIVRIESGLMAMGHEFGHMQDAFEAGLGFAVDLKKQEFIGLEALKRNHQSLKKKLVGLILEGNEVAQCHDQIYDDRTCIGKVTSGVFSPMLQKSIAMASINIEYSQEGNQVEIGKIDNFAKRLKATICSIPFFDPERKRARNKYL